MPLESAEYIAGLVPTNPVGTDPKSQGDDHLTLIKKTLVQSFPGVDAECDFTPEQVNSWEERIALLEGVALAAVDVAGLNLVEFALPAGVKRISLQLINFQAGGNFARIRFLSDSNLQTTNYVSAGMQLYDGQAVSGVNSVVGFVYQISQTNPPMYGQIDFTLIDEDNNVWSVLGSLARFNNSDSVNVQGTWQGAGFPVDAIRIANQNDDAMGAGLIACKYWG